jgi:O-antigen ligase/polysaccharide polymerase Wzy-like membrane protein
VLLIPLIHPTSPEPPRSDAAGALPIVQALLAWSLFAFGGAYFWTTWPIVAGAALLVWRARPHVAAPPWRALDVSLILALAAVLCQALPLPRAIVRIASPHALETIASLRVGGQAGPLAPLSLDPGATLRAFVVGLAIVAVFWGTRTALAKGGVRRLIRAIGWLGLLVALVAIVQRALSPLLIYGVWMPLDRGARPFGPFVNRNHLVTWMLMAIPLAAGYILAKTSPGDRHRAAVGRGNIGLSSAWLTVSSAVMIATVFISLSRSGIIGIAAIAVMGALFTRGRLRHAQIWWLGLGAAAAAIFVASFTNMPALLARLDTTIVASTGGTDRRDIWRETIRMIGDFRTTGIGVGAYQVGMLVYQTVHRGDIFFNQAHNQFLQFVAEGGVLVTLPAACAVWTWASAARVRLRRDESGLYWLRAAAITGMFAALMQGIWETGLTMPANGVMFAVLAAIAVHERAE